MYSYMFSPESASETNIANLFVHWPGNAGTAVFVIICYTRVLLKLRKSRQAVLRAISSTQEALKKAHEARLAMQFLVIVLVYVTGWGMHRFLPILIGNRPREAYVVLALLAAANSSVNPVIYLGKYADAKTVSHELIIHQSRGHRLSRLSMCTANILLFFLPLLACLNINKRPSIHVVPRMLK